jgi:hypothetical protein
MTDEAQSNNGETAETEAVVTMVKREEVLSASTDEPEPEEKLDTLDVQAFDLRRDGRVVVTILLNRRRRCLGRRASCFVGP